MCFCTQSLVWKVRFKDFCKTKIDLTVHRTFNISFVYFVGDLKKNYGSGHAVQRAFHVSMDFIQRADIFKFLTLKVSNFNIS